MRIAWISADTLIRSLPAPCILVCERLNAFPKIALESFLRQMPGPFEDNSEADKGLGGLGILPGELHQLILNDEIIPGAFEIPSDIDTELSLLHGRLRSHAGKLPIGDKGLQACS